MQEGSYFRRWRNGLPSIQDGGSAHPVWACRNPNRMVMAYLWPNCVEYGPALSHYCSSISRISGESIDGSMHGQRERVEHTLDQHCSISGHFTRRSPRWWAITGGDGLRSSQHCDTSFQDPRRCISHCRLNAGPVTSVMALYRPATGAASSCVWCRIRPVPQSRLLAGVLRVARGGDHSSLMPRLPALSQDVNVCR